MNGLIKMIITVLMVSCSGCAYIVHDPYPSYGYYCYPGYGETRCRLGVDAGLSISETHANPHPYPYVYRGGCTPFCL